MGKRSTRPPKLLAPCKTDDQLHAWLAKYVQIDVPRLPVCAGHDAPFEYIRGAYFEPARDQVVWAPRGGGKTRLAAAATLLDLLHKPGVSVRILGGSLDQSLRMWEYLLPDLENLVPDEIVSRARRTIHLRNRSSVAVLTQSQRAVRGLRIQKLRCDELELFKPEIWEAAQLVTRSRDGASGSIEALSTLHTPYGLMAKIVGQAAGSGVRVVRWCLLEVLQRCPAERRCDTCELWDDCAGVAKEKCAGFVSIDDAIRMKRRVSRDTWTAEMLCQKPSVRNSVFPAFDEAVHVTDHPAAESGLGELNLAIDFGYSAPFVCLWILSYPNGMSHVIDEYVQRQRTVPEHIQHIKQRPWGTVSRVLCDPAGLGRSEHSGQSSIDYLRQSGFRVRCRKSFIIEGLELIRSGLEPASGAPSLFVHPRCVRVIKAMRGYRYSAEGSELPMKDGDHDHLIDALRYYFVNRTARAIVSRSY